MPLAMSLEGETCKHCGEEELIYWTKDETESVIEAKMDCKGCGYEYPKIVIQKSEDTSDSAVRERLVDRHL